MRRGYPAFMKNQLFSWGRSGRPEGGLGFPRCSLPLVCYVLLRLVYWYSVCWGLVPALKLEGLYDAIAEGLRTPGLKERLEGLEARLKELGADLEAPAPSPVRLHPGMAAHYRETVVDLIRGLADSDQMATSWETLRALIDKIVLTPQGPGGGSSLSIDLHGTLASLLRLALGLPVGPGGVKMQKAPRGAGLGGTNHVQSDETELEGLGIIGELVLVAGAGFEPAAFRL